MSYLLRYRFFCITGLLFLAILAYAHTLKSSFHYDDHHQILSNKSIRDITEPDKVISSNRIRPILMLSFAFSYHFGKTNVFGYHLFNIILHCFVSLLIYFIAEFISRRQIKDGIQSRHHHRMIPLVSSALFLLHPINTNSVTYIASRSSVMCSFFLLVSFLLFIRSTATRAHTIQISGWLLYLVSFLFFILSLGTKEIAAILPFLLILHHFIFLKDPDKSYNFKSLLKYLPYFLVLPGLFLLRFYVMGAFLEKDPVFLRLFSRGDYIITQIHVITYYYFLKFILPFELAFYSDFPVLTSFFLDIKSWFPVLFLSSLVYFSIKQINSRPFAAFGVLWIFIGLLPTSSFIPIIHVAVEHRLYLPGIGFSFTFAALLTEFMSGHDGTLLKKRSLPVLLIFLLLSVYTIKRNTEYLTEPRLWFDVMKKSPNLVRPYYDYGHYLIERKKTDEGIQAYKEALRINFRDSKAHNNLGGVYFRLGKMKKAHLHFREAIKYDNKNPDAHYNMGLWLLKSGKINEAFSMFQKTIILDSRHSMALNNVGKILLEGKRLEEGKGYLLKALNIEPESPEILNNLGLACALKGEHSLAFDYYKKAIKIKPNFAQAHFNLGLGLADLGRFDSSKQHIKKAAQLDEGFREKANRYLALIKSRQNSR